MTHLPCLMCCFNGKSKCGSPVLRHFRRNDKNRLSLPHALTIAPIIAHSSPYCSRNTGSCRPISLALNTGFGRPIAVGDTGAGRPIAVGDTGFGRPISLALNTGSWSPGVALRLPRAVFWRPFRALYSPSPNCSHLPQADVHFPSSNCSHLPQADVHSPSPNFPHLPQADVHSPSPFMERGWPTGRGGGHIHHRHTYARSTTCAPRHTAQNVYFQPSKKVTIQPPPINMGDFSAVFG